MILSHRSIHLFHTSKKVEVADDSFHLVSQRKMMFEVEDDVKCP